MTRDKKHSFGSSGDAAQAKASEYHRSIGAALEDIADQIPTDAEIHIVVSSGLFEAKLIDCEDGSEVPIHVDFSEFADELIYLLNVAKGLRARKAVLKGRPQPVE